jgi:hypothetical protein
MIRVRVRGRVRVRVRVGFHTCCVLLVSRLVLNIMLVGERFLLLPLGLGLGLGYHTATVSVAPGQCKGANPLPFSYRCHPNTPLQVVDLCKGGPRIANHELCHAPLNGLKVVDLCKGAIAPINGQPVQVVAAGGIFDGRGLAMALSLGASAVWVGTRFVNLTPTLTLTLTLILI